MLSRAVAATVALTFTWWIAAPALATVTCRPEVVRCTHCPKPKSLPVPAAKADCCIVTPAAARPSVDGPEHAPRFVLAEAVDQHLPPLVDPSAVVGAPGAAELRLALKDVNPPLLR